MGSLSHLAHMTHAAVILLFADLACASTIRANEIMERFPEYRTAKGSVSDAFWHTRGVEMLADIKRSVHECESEWSEDLALTG